MCTQSFSQEASIKNDVILFETLKRSSNSWDGTPLPDYPKGKPNIVMVRVTIPKGESIAWHKHPVINAGFLIKGEIKLKTENNRELTLRSGEAIIELVNKWHTGKSVGADDAEILVVYASTKNTALTVFKH